MEKMTRNEAISANKRRYFTGLPCKRDHICERYTINTLCIMCQLAKTLAYTRTKGPAPNYVEFYAVVDTRDGNDFVNMVIALTFSRHPLRDFPKKFRVKRDCEFGSRARYKMRVCAEDVDALRAYEGLLRQQRALLDAAAAKP